MTNSTKVDEYKLYSISHNNYKWLLHPFSNVLICSVVIIIDDKGSDIITRQCDVLACATFTV